MIKLLKGFNMLRDSKAKMFGYMVSLKEAFEGVGIKNAEIVMEIPDKPRLRVVAS